MRRQQIKRETDLQIISEWIGQDQHVLDVGCGRGILLEHLMRTHGARVLGVDSSLSKAQSCVKRGVPVYHGEAESFLTEFPERFFDWVILSRTVQELDHPGLLIRQALHISRNVAVGFVNHGYWLNRWHVLRSGSRVTNEVFPLTWDEGEPYNPVTIQGFQRFAAKNRMEVANTAFLKGNWRTPVSILPNLFAGYALFHLKSG